MYAFDINQSEPMPQNIYFIKLSHTTSKCFLCPKSTQDMTLDNLGPPIWPKAHQKLFTISNPSLTHHSYLLYTFLSTKTPIRLWVILSLLTRLCLLTTPYLSPYGPSCHGSSPAFRDWWIWTSAFMAIFSVSAVLPHMIKTNSEYILICLLLHKNGEY